MIDSGIYLAYHHLRCMAKPKFKILIKESYLQTIKNSIGTRMFRNFFIIDDQGKKRDVLMNGRHSCASFVSSILKLFSLITYPHATIESTIKDMLKNGWRVTKKLKPGNVLLWEEKEGNKHMGFFIGNKKAVSNAFFYYKSRVPIAHHFTYGKTGNNLPRRRIEKIFTHKILE